MALLTTIIPRAFEHPSNHLKGICMTTEITEDYEYHVPTYWERKRPGGDVDLSRPYDRYTDLKSEVDNSAKNLNWRDDIRNGKCATTTSSGYRQTCEYEPYWFACENGGGYTWLGTDSSQALSPLGTIPVVGPYDLGPVIDKALTNYVSKAQETVQAFEGLTFLGELAETIRMVTRPAGALKRGILDYIKHTKADRVTRKSIDRARKSSSIGAFIRIASGSWLEAALGWQPLLGDIDRGCDALTRFKEPVKRLIPIRGFAELSGKTLVSSETVIVGPLSFYRELWESYENFCVFRGRVIWDPDAMLGSDDFKYWGFHLRDVVPSAWNLIPGSFVADYFSNIGDIVTGWSFGTSSLAWTDRLTRRDLRRYLSNQTVPDWVDGQSPGVSQEARDPVRIAYELERLDSRLTSFYRLQHLGDLVPSFRWDLPFSGRKIANVASLLAQGRIR